jgi:general stress protein 26
MVDDGTPVQGAAVTLAAAGQPRVTFDRVLAELRNHHFAVLSTVDEDGTPHAAGVTYGSAYAGRELVLYVMTRRHLRKAREISRDPRVALVVPVEHRILRFLLPATIQLHGRAEILDWTDEAGSDVFRGFWLGRRILAAYQAAHRRGETRICFLKIVVDPVITTYMVGVSVWELRRRMERGAARVLVPTDQVPPVPSSNMNPYQRHAWPLPSAIPGLLVRFDPESLHELIEPAEQVHDGHHFQDRFVL